MKPMKSTLRVHVRVAQNWSSHACHMTHLRPLVVPLGYRVKPLCSRGVPYLKSHLVAVNSQGPHFEINSYGNGNGIIQTVTLHTLALDPCSEPIF